jgi:hypothetical protein
MSFPDARKAGQTEGDINDQVGFPVTFPPSHSKTLKKRAFE